STDAGREAFQQPASPACPSPHRAAQEKSRRAPAPFWRREAPRLDTPAPRTAAAREPFVIPHHELRLELLHGIHGHAHNNQQRRAAEIEIDVQALKDEAPEMLVNPPPTSGKCCRWMPEIIHS